MKQERVSMRWRGFGAAILLAVTLPLAACAAGSQQASNNSPPAAAAPLPDTAQPPAEQPSSNSLPLVDSRGQMVPAMPASAPAQGGGGTLVWTKPASWAEETPSSSMRKAQYSLPAASGDSEAGQCAVFYFGTGQGGDIQGNVDRWAAQFADGKGGHPSPTVTDGSVSGMKVMKVVTEGTYTPSPMMGGDTTPKPGQMLLGAIVQGPDANWFFKCTGPKKTIESHRKEFDALIDSVKVH
jgi:hypothetical protein